MIFEVRLTFLIMLYVSAEDKFFDCGDAEDRLRCKSSCPMRRSIFQKTCPFDWVCCLGKPSSIFTPLRQAPFYKPPASAPMLDNEQAFAYLINKWNETDPYKVVNTQSINEDEPNNFLQERLRPYYPPYLEDDIFQQYADRKSVKYCKKYRELTVEYLHAGSLLSEFMPFTLPMENCIPIFMPLIVGGQNVDEGEFPHMAAIGYLQDGQTEYLCGGTLISNKYLLTSAHCVLTQWGPPVTVMLNSTVLHSPNSLEIKIKQSIVHPDYQNTSYYNDIALVELTEEVELSQTLRPACLALPGTEAQKPGSVTIAIGWGRTGFGSYSAVPTNKTQVATAKLKKVPLKIIANNKCKGYYVDEIGKPLLEKGITEKLLCATGYASEYHDTCQGDSGGPLQSYLPGHNCMLEVVGITTFGKTCGTAVPAVYTKIEPYISWIEDIVWP